MFSFSLLELPLSPWYERTPAESRELTSKLDLTGGQQRAVRPLAERSRHATLSREFNPDRWQIITADGADIGILIVEYRATEVYLARIELHPELQGRGIGAHLIQRLLDDADRRGQHLVLQTSLAGWATPCSSAPPSRHALA